MESWMISVTVALVGVVSTFAVLRSKGEISKEYIYSILRMPFALNQLGARVGGGTYPTIKVEDVKEIKVPTASPKIQRNITSRVQELFKLQESEEKIRNIILSNLENL